MPNVARRYPIMLNLQNRVAVVVGGGRVATRKTRYLLEVGAKVIVISPTLTNELHNLSNQGQIEWHQSNYQRDLLNQFMPMVVIVTTDDSQINQMVVQDSQRIRALVNNAGAGTESDDFDNMAHVEKFPITVAVSTHGQAPMFTHQLKQVLETAIGDEYATLATWLGDARPVISEAIETQAKRQSLYDRLVQSSILDLLKSGQTDAAHQLFETIINKEVTQ